MASCLQQTIRFKQGINSFVGKKKSLFMPLIDPGRYEFEGVPASGKSRYF
jgi:hypothetical protein